MRPLSAAFGHSISAMRSVWIAWIAAIFFLIAVAALAVIVDIRAVLLLAGVGLTLSAAAVGALMVHHAKETSRARDTERELAGALKRVESDAHLAWRMLKDEQIIDGFALWDEEARLVDFSGFLGHYLPQLSVWERPTARQIVEALVLGGHVVLPEGKGVDQAIAEMCMMRKVVPGLREMTMSDGQIVMARTVDLGDGRQACIFNNVTELRTHESERRASEALFRTTFESGPLMMALLDCDEKPIAVNRAFTSVLGYSLDAFAQLKWPGLLHPDDASPNRSQDEAVPWEPVVKRLLAADGRVVRGQVRFTPVRDAEGRREGRLLVTIEDLTSRWEAEERVRYQAALLDQLTTAVLSVDRFGRIAYANRPAQQLFKWTQAVMHGTPVDTLLDSGILSVLGSENVEIQTEGITWPGDRFPVSVKVSRLSTDNGEPVGALLLVTDRSERRIIDANTVHDLNQCLHVIRLSAEALAMDLADGHLDADRASKRADNILSQVERLSDLVQVRPVERREQASPTSPAKVVAEEADDQDDAYDGRRILVVDDEALSVMMVEEFLERQGYLVDTAYDGVEALRLIGKQVYDAVVTDIRMPRLDGRELIKRLAELQPGTPVIVVTGHLSEGSEAELGGNVVALLTKPFQLLDLRRHLNAATHGGNVGEDAGQ